jgi:hypothetical protein
MAMYCYISPLRNAKLCGVPSAGIVKVECAVGRKGCGIMLERFNVISVSSLAIRFIQIPSRGSSF